MVAVKNQTLSVIAPSFQVAQYTIVGVAPYVQNKFSAKAKNMMIAAQEAGAKGKTKKARESKDFEATWKAAAHFDAKGRYGIPAPNFRNGMISACRTAGIVMTRAKLSVFIEADTYDAEDNTPLCLITKGEPYRFDMAARNQTGVADIRTRPMWDPGWEAQVHVRFDSDMIDLESVTNLLVRVGLQVGVGEGRPDSRNSCGLGWGLFEVKG